MWLWFCEVLPELGHGEKVVDAAESPFVIVLFQHRLQELSYGDVPGHCASITSMITVMYVISLSDRDVKRDGSQCKRHEREGLERSTML